MVASFMNSGNRSIRRKSQKRSKSLTNFITWCCIEYTSQQTGIRLTTSVVMDTYCTHTCKPNYHMIMV